MRSMKGGTAQVRFQPNTGHFLAAAAENAVSIFDVETYNKKCTLQSLELWNMVKNQSLMVQVHEGLIAALAQSPVTGMVASTRHDNSVKVVQVMHLGSFSR